jgi:hypothetical protein
VLRKVRTDELEEKGAKYGPKSNITGAKTYDLSQNERFYAYFPVKS